MVIRYSTDTTISVNDFIDVLQRSSLDERRPVDDADCMSKMIEHADIIATAWDADKLVGIARCVTDFAYACYLSDLAVDKHYQRQGIGKALQKVCEDMLGPKCSLILLAAPKAAEYYPHIGYTQHMSCWVKKPSS